MRYTLGNIVLEARQLPDGRWRCTYDDGGRKHLTYANQDKMRRAMESLARRLQDGGEMRQISEREWRQYQAYKAQDHSARIEDVAERFLARQRLKSRRSERTLHETTAAVGRLVAYFEGRRMAGIDAAEVDGWIHLDPAHAPLTRHHRRALCVQFWSFARDQELIPYSRTAAEKTAEINVVPGQPEILTPDHMATVLSEVREDWLPYVLLAGFAGIRHQEIRPDRHSHKDPLRWEDIGTDYIRIRAETSKGRRGRPRIIPIQPNLAAWLRSIGPHVGLVVPGKSAFTAGESTRLATRLGLARWPHNCLRHSYGTYRMAICRDAGRVSDEMGNGISDIRRHYDRVALPEDGQLYWSIMPDPARAESKRQSSPTG